MNESESRTRKAGIPDGLEDFLLAFTVSILRAKPANLLEYSLSYFTLLNREQMASCEMSGEDQDEDDESATTGRRIPSCSITITTEPGDSQDNEENSK